MNKINMVQKITKKQYKKKLTDEVYFMIDTIYDKNLYGTIDLLINKSLSSDLIKSNCKFYHNINENSINFLHTNGESGEIMQENKKGSFYSIIINHVTYLLHDYKDGAISVKALI